MSSKNSWAEDFMTISTVAVPLLLILLSVFAPRQLATDEQKDTLMTAGITALVTGGFRGLGKKTEITQEVQQQELNVAPSSDNYYQYNPPARRENGYQREYLSQIEPEDASFVESREPVASSPYRVVSPDDDD